MDSWSQEFCLQLIEGYRNKEVLWNPRNPCYYNKLKKEDAWAELAASLEKTNADEIKKKMESLKGSYRREKTRVKKSKGTGTGREAMYVSKWYAFEALQFLDDKDEPRKTISNAESQFYSSNNENSAYEEDELSEVDNHSIRDGTGSPSQSAEANISAGQFEKPQITETPKKVFQSPPKWHSLKRKQTSEDPKIAEAFAYLKQAASAAKKPKDRCSVFGEYIAEKLRTFNNNRLAIAEHRINNVLFEMEMQNLGGSGPSPIIHTTVEKHDQPNISSFSSIMPYSQSILQSTPLQHTQMSTSHYSQAPIPLAQQYNELNKNASTSAMQYSQPPASPAQYYPQPSPPTSYTSTPIVSPQGSSHDSSSAGDFFSNFRESGKM